jgi:hypothetical protein
MASGGGIGLRIVIKNSEEVANESAKEVAEMVAGDAPWKAFFAAGSKLVANAIALKSCMKKVPSNPGLRKVVSYGSVETLAISPRAEKEKNVESNEGSGSGSEAESDDGSKSVKA